jgi:N-methylhydantoinase A
MSGGWRIGADIGGTFTDIVALSPAGELERIKVLSTVDDYSRGITDALRARLSADALAAVAGVVHGTTVATNAILEQEPRSLALITTRGFRDTLEIRRSRRPTLYDLDWQPPRPLVERRLRLEVEERMTADGSVLVALTEGTVRECIEAIRGEGVEAVAVCLLHSYANPEHERRVTELVAAGLPGMKVTASSAIAPEVKEYERTSTTVVNAFLLPVVDDYLSTLERSLLELGVTAPLEIMQSDGTTAAASVARERPFLIIESGPAAGVSAAARLAEEMGREAVVTFDMGGTTAKASLVEDYHVLLSEELEVGDSLNRGGGLIRGSGYVVRSPCVDLTEVGSGGGSIAWIDGGGALRVGPRSAGSNPGPACYGAGGTEPTVTDAHVVLGYVNPESIAGGTKRLHPELARAALATVAEPLGLSVEEAAYGIFSIATATMRRAVRAVSVERGRDPRAHSLFAFGGAGGIHAAALAAEMEMPEVVIPVVAGLFSSLGLLFSDLAVTRVAAHRALLTEESLGELDRRAGALAREASEELVLRHEGGEPPVVEIFLGLRYVGQSSTLTLPFAGDGADRLDTLREAFHREHRLAYGQSAEDEPVELTAIRARASRRAPVLSFAEIGRQYLVSEPASAESRTRQLSFGPVGGTHTTPIVTRGSLAGAPVDGPLVIEEPEATIVVPPDFTAELDPTGSVVLRPRPLS